MSSNCIAIDVAQGETKTLELTVTNADGDPVNLTGATVYFTVKASRDGSALIEKDSGTPAEAQITDAANGEAEIYLVASDTSSLDAGSYVYDVWVVLSGGARHQVIDPSTFEITVPVTVIP